MFKKKVPNNICGPIINAVFLKCIYEIIDRKHFLQHIAKYHLD